MTAEKSLSNLYKRDSLTMKEQMLLVVKFSLPAIFAELSAIAMQYIDAAMVGSLGAEASAAIGLMASTTWLMGGMCIRVATGFSVQVAQLIGAEKPKEARDVLRQALIICGLWGLLLSGIGIGISSVLPVWLGGEPDVCREASRYFLIYACALPANQLRQLAGSMLQCSGNMKMPSVLNAVMCLLDVIFNYFLIFPTREVSILGINVMMPGAGLGVAGAALGTALAEVVVAVCMMVVCCLKSEQLRLSHPGGSWRLTGSCMKKAVHIAVPMAFEHLVLCSAQVTITRIVAPLGTIAVAANSLAVTAESLCYMPGYGIAAAATTLVGQSIGAERKDLARRFARLSVGLGMAIMTCSGVLMYLFAPQLFAIFTPDMQVRALGAQMLRIEAFAEPLFAASIVTAGALRGAGDTLVSSVLNLISMWGVRITVAALLAPRIGLKGVWFAMCGELCVRGILFLVRLIREKWLK